MKYTIRQAVAKDLSILDRIHTENMKSYVEKIYPWNPTLFVDNFLPQDYQAIEVETRIAGFIKVVSTEDSIYLAEIQIDSHYQNQGIGTNIINTLIDRARLEQKRLWLRVIRGNPAEKLYQRLGFTIFEETTTHKKMQQGIATGGSSD